MRACNESMLSQLWANHGPEEPSEKASDDHVFECPTCHVVYMTEDHVSVDGTQEKKNR